MAGDPVDAFETVTPAKLAGLASRLDPTDTTAIRASPGLMPDGKFARLPVISDTTIET
jgi:hypothetical protein